MSHYADYAGSNDPLQRRRAAAVTHAGHAASPHPMHAGIAAIAPRLGLAFLAAGVVQMLLHWLSH